MERASGFRLLAAPSRHDLAAHQTLHSRDALQQLSGVRPGPGSRCARRGRAGATGPHCPETRGYATEGRTAAPKGIGGIPAAGRNRSPRYLASARARTRLLRPGEKGRDHGMVQRGRARLRHGGPGSTAVTWSRPGKRDLPARGGSGTPPRLVMMLRIVDRAPRGLRLPDGNRCRKTRRRRTFSNLGGRNCESQLPAPPP